MFRNCETTDLGLTIYISCANCVIVADYICIELYASSFYLKFRVLNDG